MSLRNDSMANSLAILKRSQKSWALLAQSAAWIIGILAGFLLPPPVGMTDDTRVFVRFAQFVVTFIVGFVLLASLRWKSQKYSFRWAAMSLFSLVLGCVMFFGYQLFSARWTAEYNGQRVVTGGDYTAFGKDYRQENPNLTATDLVRDVAGDVEKIWTKESLTQHRLLLAAVYVFSMPPLTVAVMSLLQAIQCATSERRKTKRPHSPRVNPV